MTKNLKFKIKNEQIAKAVKLKGVKSALKKKGNEAEAEEEEKKKKPAAKKAAPKKSPPEKKSTAEKKEEQEEKPAPKRRVKARTTSIFAQKEEEEQQQAKEEPPPQPEPEKSEPEEPPAPEKIFIPASKPRRGIQHPACASMPPQERLGPTGRHIRDLDVPTPKPTEKKPAAEEEAKQAKGKGKAGKGRFKEYTDIKPSGKKGGMAKGRAPKGRQDEDSWRKRKSRASGSQAQSEQKVVRPTELTFRLPISVKDLAAEMKLKASQVIEKLFLHGTAYTINDYLDDETTVQLVGSELGCEITIDTSEEERIQVTDQSIEEEVAGTDPSSLVPRPPVVAFMGHVDHAKTSLIDAIRKTNIAAGEAGAITQHIGAFQCHTKAGNLTVLDTPGHEAFSAMRARGAQVTDVAVLVVAGDEGLKAQSVEALQHAKAAGVTIVVAINKSDKPNFDAEQVYRQLSEHELLPEAWGGQTITVNCSAKTGEGLDQLLEMLALQAEVLELKASPTSRARGHVLESKMHKGLGATTTVLVQNGTLRPGQSVVFDVAWGRVKTMRDGAGKQLKEALPATPVEITGLSSLPEAGQEFVVVENEKQAREIAEARLERAREKRLQQKRALSVDSLFTEGAEGKKVLNIVLRTDVQGSLEALKVALEKIESDKVDTNVIFTGIGEITESDVQLASASKAVIVGFHTQVESKAEALARQLAVQIRTFDIIYHAIDEVKILMAGLLERTEERHDRGKAEVLATFRASQHGVIAGCMVQEGTIHRNHKMRQIRDGELIWEGNIRSIRRVKEDVREVQKGVECGILLENQNDVQEGDILQSFEITYRTQEL